MHRLWCAQGVCGANRWTEVDNGQDGREECIEGGSVVARCSSLPGHDDHLPFPSQVPVRVMLLDDDHDAMANFGTLALS